MRDFVEFYSNEYDEETRLQRHRTEFVATTYVLDKLIPSGSRILGVGAGTGAYSLYYARKGCSVFAVDAVQKYIDMLQVKTRLDRTLDIQAHVADIRDPSISLGSDYDVVLFMGPIYHLPLQEVDRCIDHCLRLLKPEGLFVVSYVSDYQGDEGSEYLDVFIRHTPAEIDELLGRYISMIFHGPTDGEVFGELNEVSQVLCEDVPTMHAWLRANESVFQDPSWIRTSPHGLYVGRGEGSGIQKLTSR